MRDTLVRIISIILAIISVIISIVFLQNVFYNGNPFTIVNHRVLITDKDYEDEQIKKDDIIIVNQNIDSELKEDALIIYTTDKNKMAYGKVKSIDIENKTIDIVSKNETSTIKKSSVLGTYEFKIAKIGKYILFLRTLKGFLLSLGVIFVILLIITSLSKIILFIKKLFTKKY